MKTEDIKKMGLAYLSVIEAASKKEDNSNDKSDDGDGMDKVQPKAVKKKFDDRKDKDIDNDGDTDSSDEFLHKKRKAISKSIDKEDDKEESKTKTEGQRGFIMAAKAAKANGDETFVFAGKKYNCEDALTGKHESRDWLTYMDEDEFDALIENATPEQLDEIIGTLKKIGGAAVSGAKKVANRFSTAGRADAADNKLAKAKKKIADKERLSKAKAGLAALKKKPTNEDDDENDAPENDAPANDEDPKKKKKVVEPADDEVKEAHKKKKKLKADDEDPADADSVEADDDEEKPTVAKEEATIEKTYAGVQSGMRQAMMKMWENAQTKGATKPEGINDKNSKTADKMVKDHKPEVKGDAEKVADEAASKIAGSAKASPKNKGDNAAGDKTIINKPSEK